ncbi:MULTISPECIES: hypothetical protein [Nonomuraea]|uniref:Uncharacterized protein n=1 Tax=Nonomuraea recticatena TaxID=46178 RepID=A0ABP6E2B6_9ACTN
MRRTALLAGCLMLTASCGAAATGAASHTVPHKSVTAQPVITTPSQSPTPPPKAVKPVGDTVNTRKVPFTGAKAFDRGRKVKLVWWSGVEPCTVLDRVRVKETSRRVTITLYEGTAAKAKDVSCIMMAVQKTTTVKLKAPIGKRKIVDGGKQR